MAGVIESKQTGQILCVRTATDRPLLTIHYSQPEVQCFIPVINYTARQVWEILVAEILQDVELHSEYWMRSTRFAVVHTFFEESVPLGWTLNLVEDVSEPLTCHTAASFTLTDITPLGNVYCIERIYLINLLKLIACLKKLNGSFSRRPKESLGKNKNF